MGVLGKAIEETPLGSLTPIDEALIDAGKGVGDFSREVKKDILKDPADRRRGKRRTSIRGKH